MTLQRIRSDKIEDYLNVLRQLKKGDYILVDHHADDNRIDGTELIVYSSYSEPDPKDERPGILIFGTGFTHTKGNILTRSEINSIPTTGDTEIVTGPNEEVKHAFITIFNAHVDLEINTIRENAQKELKKLEGLL